MLHYYIRQPILKTRQNSIQSHFSQRVPKLKFATFMIFTKYIKIEEKAFPSFTCRFHMHDFPSSCIYMKLGYSFCYYR